MVGSPESSRHGVEEAIDIDIRMRPSRTFESKTVCRLRAERLTPEEALFLGGGRI